jgi:hypothetical protein
MDDPSGKFIWQIIFGMYSKRKIEFSWQIIFLIQGAKGKNGIKNTGMVIMNLEIFGENFMIFG